MDNKKEKQKGYEKMRQKKTWRLRRRIAWLEADLFRLWEYICIEGLMEEARDYLEEHADSGIPFDFE